VSVSVVDGSKLVEISSGTTWPFDGERKRIPGAGH
jgi:hypothetical protein